MVQKCLCGAELKVIERGRVLRCPVEGITYMWPVSEVDRAMEANSSSRHGKESKSSLTLQEKLQDW